MSKITVNYYKSNAIPPVIRGTEIKPFFKIMSLHGFDSDNYKCINGKFNPLNALAEPKIHYVIAKSQSYLSKISLLNNWRCTDTFPIDGKTFNENVEIMIPYCELFEYCQLVFVLSNYFINTDGYLEEIFLNAGFLSLYNNHNVFRRGIYEVELHPLDPNSFTSLQSILSIIHIPSFNGKPKSIPELNKLLKIMRKKLRGQLPTVPMEKTSLSQVEQRIDDIKKSSDKVFVSINFKFTKDISQSLPIVLTRQTVTSISGSKLQRNPVEKKYYLMTRNARAIDTDRNRKPNSDDLMEIKRILKQPPTSSMTDTESDRIWMYRYHISEIHPTAISKVMMSVQWDYQGHTDQVTDILLNWPHLNPEYLIELLTSHFLSPIVRRYAVKKLNYANNEDLLLYLFQLVQALRYENHDDIFRVEPGEERLLDDSTSGLQNSMFMDQYQSYYDKSLYSFHQNKSILNSISSNKATPMVLQDDLASFLIRRCKTCRRLASYFYWFLHLESEEGNKNTESMRKMFSHVLERFYTAMDRGDLNTRENWSNITAQINFVEYLTQLVKTLSQGGLKVAHKSTLLKEELTKYGDSIPQFSFPLNADFVVSKIDVNNSTVLKSSQAPIKLSLLSPGNQRYEVIFKDGDDLRQDQVVLQMINFMDEILRRENFDLKLTPYQVLATTTRSGFIEFVKSKSISEIQNDHVTIHNYLKSVAPSAQDPDQIDKTVLDTYSRSLAGYCVITYLLGIGDRHLDNIMLTTTGHFFHIDFGFVLGNDPKPLPPEVRLTKDMIDALGGTNDPVFLQFCDYAFNTFNYLRRHANQCLSLLSLISDAGIQDFSLDGGKAACEFVRERFLLDCTEEQAVRHLADRITSSVNAIFPGMMERLHKLAMKFK